MTSSLSPSVPLFFLKLLLLSYNKFAEVIRSYEVFLVVIRDFKQFNEFQEGVSWTFKELCGGSRSFKDCYLVYKSFEEFLQVSGSSSSFKELKLVLRIFKELIYRTK